MSIIELRQYLSQQYTLKCFIDLEYISATPSGAYKQFQTCYQEVFDNSDRLVFYTTDIIPEKLLHHLYQAASQIDISNYFILICSPYDISEQLQSRSNDPFQTLQLEFEQTRALQNNYVVPDSLCPMPWMHLEVSAQGEIRPCCVSSQTVGHTKDLTLQDAFHGEMLSNLRQELLDGKKPIGCQKCWDLESKGLISNRSYHMSLLKTELLTTLDQPSIRSLDLKPGNTCNFKCRICSPGSSSLFAQEVSKFQKIPVETFNWAEDNSKTTNEIANLLPNLSNLDLYGGEPFLIKPLLKLIEQAVNLGHAKNIRLHYNSNGSVYPANLIEHWKKFRHVDIHFSIDNIGARFELERGGTWSQVESNIKNLLDLNLSNVKISIMPAISIMNVFYIDELLNWANSLNLPVNPLYVSTPDGFALKNLTTEAKTLIIDKFKNCQWPEMKNISNYITTLPASNGEEFIKLCNHFDHLRNQNFSDSHPEVAKAMGYVYNKTL
jgi:MoaA/NifB/PqqE/SkfB family radical SAM enzyme